MRAAPNILITGTPGTGKSATAREVASRAPQLRHVELGSLVREKQLHLGWDDEYECHILDEDRICDELEDAMESGGVVVDYHGADFFPERWSSACVGTWHAAWLLPVCFSVETAAPPAQSIPHPDFLPLPRFDLVVVLRTDNSILYPRLESRGYSQKKLTDNVEAEIMQVILDEARGAYPEEIVVELTSNDTAGLESNVQRLLQWVEQWSAERR